MATEEKRSYEAHCHCGAIRLSIKLPALENGIVNRCNCSICTRNGYLLVYPKREDVTLPSDTAELASYRFGNKTKPHKFCAACGSSMLIDFSESEFEVERQFVAINIRMIKGIEEVLPSLTYHAVDGKNEFRPAYEVN